MAFVPILAASAAAGLAASVPAATFAAANYLYGQKEDKREDKREDQMQQQLNEARRALKEARKALKEAKNDAVEEYKVKLIQRREKYGRPDYLPDDDIPTIGVMGESGVGKSTFINTILGERVAQAGIDEQTKHPALYMWGNVRLVDLPGGCTTKFKVEHYFQIFGIKYFDTIVVLNSDARAKQLGIEAVEHLTQNHIPTIFVLSKVETVVQGEASAEGKDADEVVGDVLDKMDEKFSNKLEEHGCSHCPVYLISSVEVKRECGSLEEVAGRKVPLQQRINQDWLPLLKSMKELAKEKKELVLEEKKS